MIIEPTTRVGELADAGYDGLTIMCRGCERTVCYPFRLLRQRASVRSDDLVIFLSQRLRCRTCRRRVDDLAAVEPWRIGDGAPRMSYLGRRPGPES